MTENVKWKWSRQLMLQWLIFLQPFSLQGNLNAEGDRVVVAKGGPGGSFYSAFQPGKGQAKHIRLDLKLIADMGLVGWGSYLNIFAHFNWGLNFHK